MELADRVALITGSTTGIGAATARLFAAEGASVVVTGRDVQRGQQVVASIETTGGRARFVAADLTDLASVQALADAAGEVDVLVNNAAMFPIAMTPDQDPASFDDAFAANVRAPFFLVARLVPGMIARGGGSVVNVTTMTAKVGMPGFAAYSASKAALDCLTRQWAAEFSGRGVRVNTLAPGATATETSIELMGDDFEVVAQTTLLKRVAQPAEIAQAILFLAGDRSSYITGASVAADGGRTAV